MSTRVRVGNLPYYTTESQLADLLAEAGQVVDVYLPGEQGVAFVEFSNPDEAAWCIKRFNEHELEGRKLHVLAADEPGR